MTVQHWLFIFYKTLDFDRESKTSPMETLAVPKKKLLDQLPNIFSLFPSISKHYYTSLC